MQPSEHEHAELYAYRGESGSGKTRTLVQAARSALQLDPTSRVLVVCATPDGVDAFARTLEESEAPGERTDQSRVRIVTPRALALDVLATPEARAFTGRDARLLLPFEESFLLEDVKTCGVRPKRLREMLRFFYRSWTELADEDEEWLITEEERIVHALVKDALAFVGGILPCELGNLAVRYLKSHTGARAEASADYVLVDDFQLLSRASQQLATLLATRELHIAANPAACTEAFDPYPYAAGFDELCSLMKAENCAHVVTLDFDGACPAARAARRVLDAPIPDISMPAGGSTRRANAASAMGGTKTSRDIPHETTPDASSNELVELVGRTPADELDRVADYAHEALAAGTPPERIVIACPNRTWIRNAERVLEKRGITCETAPDANVLACNVEDDAKNVLARAVTLLALAADPADSVAWRACCGFGVHLGNSAGVRALRTKGDSAKRLADALRAASSEELGKNATGEATSSENAQVAAMTRIYRATCATLDETHGLAGDDLLRYVASAASTDAEHAEHAFHALRALCAPSASQRSEGDREDEAEGNSEASDTRDARTMLARLHTRLANATFERARAVRIMSYGRAAGADADVVILTGMVAGFTPEHSFYDPDKAALDARERIWQKATRSVYSAASRAKKALVCSRFACTDLETATRLNAKIDRIRAENGRRVAYARPSDALAFLR